MVVRAVSGRSYLSIGDVLSLLREEFPDVTISKIRFLESQGLVDPERSPSGYRKFYDDDVARLRWVLRKQRDQFLPLKVIRDRLAAAGRGVPADDEPDAEGTPEWSQAEPEAQGAEDAAGTDVFPHAARAADAARAAHAAGKGGAQASNGAAEHQRAAGRSHVVDADTPTGRTEGARAPAEAEPALRAVAQPAAAPQATATAVADRAPSLAEAPPVPAQAAAREAAATSRSRHSGVPDPDPPGRAAAAKAAGGRVAPAGAADVLSASVTGVSLSLAELCAATGLTPDAVASLEGLGLLAPMSIAGGTYYDEEALTVGKLVAEFSRYGVEPRHLRMYRNAVDREVGLVEQVITPLLRQRNPEARQRAVEAAADLARLGQSMRASLVRSELRRQLGS